MPRCGIGFEQQCVMTTASDPALRNVRAVAELERQVIHQRSRVERITDAITQTAGSSAFIVGHAVWFVLWTILNRPPGAFDPYPYSLLNIFVSMEAIFLTSFVLMTQNRMTKQADKRAHLDLQVNLLAEEELTTILQMLHALCQKAGTHVKVNDARVEQLLKQTDILQLAVTLDQELASDK